ncbi:MAG: ATP-dependent DNA helicase, partial [Bdellovibrionales bacterium]|nr:ATP-dependent DNA helicase [Bdellovibrionales bacterium]
RRLFYVGVTRAKKELLLTRSRKRKRYGKWRDVSPSRFLCEIPPELVTLHENGCRPLSETSRTSLLADLYKKLDKDIKNRQEV